MFRHTYFYYKLLARIRHFSKTKMNIKYFLTGRRGRESSRGSFVSTFPSIIFVLLSRLAWIALETEGKDVAECPPSPPPKNKEGEKPAAWRVFGRGGGKRETFSFTLPPNPQMSLLLLPRSNTLFRLFAFYSLRFARKGGMLRSGPHPHPIPPPPPPLFRHWVTRKTPKPPPASVTHTHHGFRYGIHQLFPHQLVKLRILNVVLHRDFTYFREMLSNPTLALARREGFASAAASSSSRRRRRGGGACLRACLTPPPPPLPYQWK